MELRIERIYGQAPVQAEGTLDGFPFYFRARGSFWSFGLSLDGRDPVDVEMAEQGFYREGMYEKEFDISCMSEEEAQRIIEEGTRKKEFDASYMPEEEAQRIIEECAHEYEASKKGSP